MNLEDLNKTQIILLTLLVSFVSAIATSIFTVKLLEEAPAAVTQTINRVVERTIERVVPAEPSGSGKIEQTVIEKETTIVVKEEDLITDSIEKNKRTIVRLVQIIEKDIIRDPASTSTEPLVDKEYIFHGIGVIVRSSGLIVTASQLADVSGLFAITPDGVEHKISLLRSDDSMALLQIEPIEGQEDLSLSTATFADESALRLGQTVIAIGGEDRTSVSVGIVASILEGSVGSGEGSRNGIVSLQTNVSGSIPGSPLVNIFGEVVGINVDGVPGLFTSSSVIQEGMKPIEASIDTENIETTEAESATAES